MIGVQRAQRAFDRMIDRKKYRGFGVPIFQEQILRQLGVQPQSGMQPPPMQNPMQPPPLPGPAPGPPPNQHRDSAPHGLPQMGPQMPQQMPHRPPAQQMPPPQQQHPPPAMPYGRPGAPPIVYQAMQQVGVDMNGNPVYQPVQQPPYPPQNQMGMPPPKRTMSHPQAPQRAPPHSMNSAMQQEQ